jgi:hypothetical protein
VGSLAIFTIELKAVHPCFMPIILATQEDCGSKPAWANSSWDPISKNPITKKLGWWTGSRWRPWVQAPVPQKRKL